MISRHFEEQGLREDEKKESPELSKKTFMERNDPVDETYLDYAYNFLLQIRRQVQRQALEKKILPQQTWPTMPQGAHTPYSMMNT